MKDGIIKCKRCHGNGEYRVRIYHKGKIYYYFSKCGKCYGKGYLDWVENARGRLPGLRGMFVDTHPAGSLMMDREIGGCAIYDGHKYIDVNTPKGEALWDNLVGKEEYNE
jgi:hypothetical protein